MNKILINYFLSKLKNTIKLLQNNTIHMPQKWNLSSVNCIFRKTRVNRILVKQCVVDCAAQCNHNFGTHSECVKWKPVKIRNCTEGKVVIYCILITTRNAKSNHVASKTRNVYLE